MFKRKSRKRNLQRRKRQSSSSLHFGRLEPRQLLAGMVSAELNLISNGDFSSATNGTQGMFDQADVVGWQATDAGSGQMINLIDVAKDDRGNVLDLDSTSAIFDSVFQDVSTIEDHNYLLTFDLRERPNSGTGLEEVTNDVEVTWNGDSLGTFRGIGYWNTITLFVQGGTGDTSTLEFREVVDGSVGSDGRGPLIDNVQLVNVSGSSLENGSFETTTDPVEGDPQRFPSATFPVWGAYGPSQFRTIDLVTGDNVQGAPTSATDGLNALNVDGSANNVDRIYSELATTDGAEYFLTFDLRAASDQVVAENELRVRWNNEWVGTFHGGIEWQSFGVHVTASSDLTKLVFREPGSHLGDGQGPIIDNVQLVQVDSASSDLSVDLNGDTAGTDTTATFAESTGQETLLNVDDLALQNLDGENLSGVRVLLTNRPDGTDEVLSVDTGETGIVANFNENNGFLSLTGSASVSDYQSVLATLSYNNLNQDPDPTDRLITVEAVSGTIVSDAATITVSVLPQNDAPEIDAVADQTAEVGVEFSQQITARDPENTALSYSVSYEGLAIGDGDNEPAISASGLLTWTPSRSGSIDVTVTVTDADGVDATEEFTVTANIVGEVPGDFAPFSGARQLSGVTPSLRNGIYDSAPAMTIDTNKDYTATIETAYGDIEIELYDDQAPITVNNFVNLANDGYYDGLTFDRVIEGFVAQGGDPLGTTSGGPGYSFVDEFDDSLRFNGSGILAMANSGANTNGSQFFITYGSQPHLNDAHTIFGQITSGEDAFDSIQRRVPEPGAAPADIIYSITINES